MHTYGLISYNVYKDKSYSFSATRFRWTQKADGNTGPSHEWGIREIYVGKACSEHCNGHGSCRYPVCACDQGYSGPDCLYDRFPNPVSRLSSKLFVYENILMHGNIYIRS